MTLLRVPGICIVAVVLGAALLNPGSALGAQPESAGQVDKLQALIKELKTQLDRGERDRLIDPWFLRDLRAVLGRYEWPWQKRLFRDDFSGPGPQPDPPWKVTAGEFLIDWRFGLRSVVKAQRPPSRETRGSDREGVEQLFGQILQQALQGQEVTEEPGQPPQRAPEFAAAIVPVAITSAFALRLEMTSRALEMPPGGRLEFGPYQGKHASAGYRLVYAPNAPAGAPSLELVSLSPRGTVATVELYDKPLKLEDGQPHVFEWTRDVRGRMIVWIDGAEVMNVVDRRFRHAFDGFIVVNRGGDYAVRTIRIDGTG